MSKRTKPGPDVEIDGIRRATVIDVQGVQRFPSNEVIRRLYDAADERGYNLNNIWQEFQSAKRRHTKVGEDMRALYRAFGYSICGYTEIFPNDVIRNPLWDAPAHMTARPRGARRRAGGER
jgi:hypothetical protein